MRKFLVAVLALVWAAATPVAAGNGPVVVELYTSQGCSSCPPADALLKKLAARDGVIALALHVDYWDYIGWKDIFGDPAYSERQRSYARNAGRRAVYTPQMIIGGRGHVVGNKPMEIMDQIEAARKSNTDDVSLSLRRRGAKVEILARGQGGQKGKLMVQLVRYLPSSVVKITRGENAGRTIEYNNIVTQWRELDTWDGTGELRLSAPAPGDEPVVVIIQQAGPGLILAAAQLR